MITKTMKNFLRKWLEVPAAVDTSEIEENINLRAERSLARIDAHTCAYTAKYDEACEAIRKLDIKDMIETELESAMREMVVDAVREAFAPWSDMKPRRQKYDENFDPIFDEQERKVLMGRVQSYVNDRFGGEVDQQVYNQVDDAVNKIIEPETFLADIVARLDKVQLK